MMHCERMSRVQRWETRFEWPLAIAALLFLAAFAWPILDTSLSHGLRQLCSAVDYGTWAMFAVDYLVRLLLAERRLHYAASHLLDLLVITLPMLRPLRLLRFVTLLRFLNRQATESLQGRIAVYIGGSTALVLFCAALAELDAERHSRHANITSFADALWWAFTTVSTVGYGDRYPVTTEGRLVGVGLMLAGVALLGVVTASIASWLIERVRQEEAATQAATRADIAALSSEIAALRAEVERRP